MSTIKSWSIPGVEGQPILGDTHLPEDAAQGVIIIAHGLKGYKDYGMFPVIASACASEGLIAHRFNFSHSGMTNDIDMFARPDLFERDTWNKQVYDCRAVVEATASGALDGAGLPYVLFGHSRGGVTVLLTAGRFADDASFPQPMGIVVAATPSWCNPLSDEEAAGLLEKGYLESPSARTGQDLRIGRAFLQEQLDDPGGHDLPALASRIHCATLIIHGSEDPTVPVACAEDLRKALGERSNERIIAGGDHVFNTPNPMPLDEAPGPQLRELLEATVHFAVSVCGMSGD
jgi:alpha-beta hydrolase superfamily lysophospholipase